VNNDDRVATLFPSLFPKRPLRQSLVWFAALFVLVIGLVSIPEPTLTPASRQIVARLRTSGNLEFTVTQEPFALPDGAFGLLKLYVVERRTRPLGLFPPVMVSYDWSWQYQPLSKANDQAAKAVYKETADLISLAAAQLKNDQVSRRYPRVGAAQNGSRASILVTGVVHIIVVLGAMIAFVWTTYLLFRTTTRERSLLRALDGRCPRCNYRIGGSDIARCPECGKNIRTLSRRLSAAKSNSADR
jgi:hypothetical protein